MDHINRNKKQSLILFIGILLIGASLRAPITSVGIALPSIKDTLNLSNTSVSLITIIPLLSFAVISLFAAKISHKFGLERTVFGALILICVGIALRAITGVSWLYVGTILIGVGIAFGNVLTPGIIKMNFPLRIGIMTGYYTVVMNIFGSVSSYVTAPLVKHFNYNIAISLIGIVTFIGIITWSFQLNKHDTVNSSQTTTNINVWKSPLSWQITLLMGGQSMIFYSLINWLPEFLLSHGTPINEAGIYLSILQLAIIPLTFVTPIFAEKMKNQVLITFVTGLLFVLGILMLMLQPNWAFLGIILIGVASGLAFGLVNTFFGLRTENGLTAAKLSGMSQSVGYLFAAIGPLLFGILHDATNSWNTSFGILLVTSIIIMIIGSRAGRNITIEQTLGARH
ncbi:MULTISPECIES: CynX/NimT family MFS transporter [Mammaliicoccus]|uniref:MFS transporter n=1 Tax=Mammaliicoccus sciuri TaxID=1296 RepID=A0AAW5LMW6_MAMSC|nr:MULTISPECIES: MFS transporter [Mammaliicoccus]MBG9211016.1 MFS transporter [Mammaliicoccus sciuri]MCD5139749.1 MFS transporter [Mammaliicoccus sciuri]MCI8455780.1 MFS transporter [Mammaliicoccus sciuri]MCQ9303779.1 MFS transporter [Mammaliicoccus sciuri]MDT0745677.1 MFS transporter [Mammaliicoccus sciuri]